MDLHLNKPSWQEEASKLREAAPGSILFLCVHNAARSQMAEGIARQLAPAGVSVYSAGSRPSRVHPEAVQVMREIGVDISGQRSKGLDEVPADQIEAVVTLCAEEICPLFLSRAMQVHWAITDPAAQTGDEATRLEAFRQARDLLRERLARVFEG